MCGVWDFLFGFVGGSCRFVFFFKPFLLMNLTFSFLTGKLRFLSNNNL